MTLIGLPLLTAFAARHPRALPHFKALAALLARPEIAVRADLESALAGLVGQADAEGLTLDLPEARVRLAVHDSLPLARILSVEPAR